MKCNHVFLSDAAWGPRCQNGAARFFIGLPVPGSAKVSTVFGRCLEHPPGWELNAGYLREVSEGEAIAMVTALEVHGS